MSRKKDYTKNIIDALFNLTPNMPWQDITMEEIAKVVKLDQIELDGYFTSKISILIAYNNQIDHQLNIEFNKKNKSANLNFRDEIFDIIMTKYDMLNIRKDGIRHIFKRPFPIELVASPKSYLNLSNSMKLVLNLAGVTTNTPIGCLRVNILSGIFLNSFLSWLNDDSLDMSKTMVSLDKGLKQAEALQTIMPR